MTYIRNWGFPELHNAVIYGYFIIGMVFSFLSKQLVTGKFLHAIKLSHIPILSGHHGDPFVTAL